ncbi:hypothetical protein BMS3Bbin11_01171 [bacterium BMS3Bbin11]|nr:hypothetical protein BMS3Bbin11_01171 [bacterium BMS3Bbin11]
MYHRLGGILGLLVIVCCINGCIFICRWVFNISVHTTGATVNEFTHALFLSCFQNITGTTHIDFVVIAIRYIEFPECRSQMLDHIDPLHAFFNHFLIRHTANNHFGPHIAELIGCQPFLIIKRYDFMSLINQASDQCLASKTCSSSNQYFHLISFNVLSLIVFPVSNADYRHLRNL